MAETSQNRSVSNSVDSQALLLRSIAEQLKTPLMYLARQSELGQQSSKSPEEIFKSIEYNADMALQLVDSYLLGLDITNNQAALELEPVPIAATLYDIAHVLTPFAKQHNTDIELVLAGKYGQVMAHSAGLHAALYGLGFVLSEIAHPKNIRNTLRIVARRTRGGITSGFYLDGAENLHKSLKTAKLSQDKYLRQPFAEFTHSTGAGVLIADTIFSAMQVKLKASSFKGSQGFAVTLQQSKQLQLV